MCVEALSQEIPLWQAPQGVPTRDRLARRARVVSPCMEEPAPIGAGARYSQTAFSRKKMNVEEYYMASATLVLPSRGRRRR